MRKIVFAAFILGAVSFTSCRKEYICDCQKIYTGSSSSYTVDDGAYTYKDTRPRAEEKCNAREVSGSDLGGDYSRECQIR